VTAPQLDPRGRDAIEADLLRRLPGYLAGWCAGERGPAAALLAAIAGYRHILAVGANELPARTLLAGLDALGLQLAPASAARLPLVFTLAPDAPTDVTLPAGSQAAAPPTPEAPSIDSQAPATVRSEAVVFATERTVTLTRARLKVLASIDPGSDRFTDHTARLTTGFTLFDDAQPMEHAIYLGHDTLFALGGEIAILIGVSLDRGAAAPLDLQWEYLAEAGWIPLPAAAETDTTAGLTVSGQITLVRACGPDAKRDDIAGHSSFWIRARSRTPVVEGAGALPLIINDLTARVAFRKRGLLPEAAFADFAKLDVSKDFAPFGALPATFSTFYVASNEVFQRAGAVAQLTFDVSVPGTPKSSLALAWEYSTSEGWVPLTVMPDPSGADAFVFSESTGIVHFTCPEDWAEVDVNGTSKRWLRVRIVAGHYGEPLHIDTSTTPPGAATDLAPPMVARLSLSFEYLTEPSRLDHCVSFNDFVFRDHTDACQWPDQSFDPFRATQESASSVHFGFDAALPVGLVSVFIDVPSTATSTPPVSPYVWEYRRSDGWAELSVVDETAGLRQSGMLQFIGPRDASASAGIGGVLYRLRARIKQGESQTLTAVAGLWPNAVWAAHQRRIERELLGLSDGNPGQTLRFAQSPVLAGERIEVREWTGRGSAWRTALAGVPEGDLRFDRDPATQVPTAAWVRWHERAHLHDSTSRDRHYTIDRATGRLRFGAAVPAAGKRVIATYHSGGGLPGNVAAASVRELRVAIPFVAAVDNPIRAQGGAEAEAAPGVLVRGAERLRHRNRALAARDYEWLARDASPEVARARLASLVGPNGHAERGAVTIAIAQSTADPQPRPSMELARRVRDHVAAHAPAGVVVRITAAAYVPVSVLATIVPTDPALAALVETRVRHALNRFLHPLTGGAGGRGWDFGEALHLSQIAWVIESTPGVDFASVLMVESEGAVTDGVLPVPADRLVAAGAHELTLRMETR
jgi:hypothetical protein